MVYRQRRRLHQVDGDTSVHCTESEVSVETQMGNSIAA